MEAAPKLLILYATQTGNALDAAERLSREAERRACSVKLSSMDDYDPSLLPMEEAVIFVVSTTGQGDTPDSMKAFWKYLLKRNLSNKWLEGVNCAVFGLGDSGYQKYNFVAKKLERRVLDLGAMAIIEKGLGDDQHPSGYEGALDPWMSSLWIALNQINPNFFPQGLHYSTPDDRFIQQPKIEIIYHDSEIVQPDFSPNLEQIGTARSMFLGKPVPESRPHCFMKMARNFPLTKVGHQKDVRHFEFEFVSSVSQYDVGDVLEILPQQDSAAVDAFIQRCNLDPNSMITVRQREMDKNDKTSATPMKLRTFVELNMDIASASPRRYFFEVMSFFVTAEHEKEKLRYFATAEGRDDLYQYNQKERRTVLEVLEDFPSAQMPFEWLVQLVPPLKTRAFSISSSQSAHPNEVHLTVSVVSWMTPYKRKRKGLCSTWLANIDPQDDVYIPVWFHKGSLPPPPASLPLILIGPGTGCAPFRGFVEERAIQSLILKKKRAIQSQAISTAPIIFFFGCRNEDNDFLYRDFWFSHSQSGGVLSELKGGGFYVAFSRDQPQKIYVQNRMHEQSHRIWNLLNEGAAIYIAGSSTKMPSDVLATFEEIVAKESGLSRESALRWIRALERSGRYHVEAWS